MTEMTNTQGATSPQIEIPEAAVRFASEALGETAGEHRDAMAHAAIAAATPLIIAAELDQQDDVLDAELQGAEPPNFEEDNYDAGYIAGLTFAQDQLRKRITELKAGAR